MTPDDRRFRLTSERLEIFPLTLEEFYLYLTDRDAFAALFQFPPPLDWHAFQTERAITSFYDAALRADPAEYFWRTLWIVKPRDRDLMLGHICFHAPPVNRRVEIAYTTETARRNCGVMTDALRLLLARLAERPDVDCVIAETKRDNIASARVLQKNGFRRDSSQPCKGYVQWRLDLSTLRRSE